jgi:GNAT superfamily N-acetyltransferase
VTFEGELPDEHDVIIWHLEDRDDLDVYRVTKGSTVLGEFTGRSIGTAVFQAAVEHAEPGRAVWLKDDLRFRRLNPKSPGP